MSSEKSYALSTTCVATTSNGARCDACNELADVQARLFDAEKLVASLKNEQTNRRFSVNASHDRLMGKVPLEIAAYIFKIYVDMDGSGGVFSKFLNHTTTNHPLRLGAICRTWRRLAWSLPQLWTTMAVDVRPKSLALPELAAQWLHRSGTLPLSIRLFTKSKSELSDFENEQAILLIRVVNTFSSRWKSLDLELICNLQSEVASFFGPGDHSQPSILQHLRVNNIWDRHPMQLFKNSKTRHSPTHVTLIDIDLDGIDVEWANVTNFEARCLQMNKACEVFRRAPRLTECLFRDMDRNRSLDSVVPPPTLTHSHLRSLKMYLHGCGPETSVAKDVLDSLTLPLLENLDFHSDMSSSMTLITLLSLIRRSSCRLESLDLWHTDFTTDELVPLLRMTASLKSLSFGLIVDNKVGRLFEYFQDETFEQDRALIPNLEEVDIRVHSGRFSCEIFLKLFALPSSTSQSSFEYRSLRVGVQLIGNSESGQIEHIDETSLRLLDELFEHGIDIAISYYDNEEEEHDLLEMSREFHDSLVRRII